MPRIDTVADSVKAAAAIASAVAGGELTPMEAAELSKVVDVLHACSGNSGLSRSRGAARAGTKEIGTGAI